MTPLRIRLLERARNATRGVNHTESTAAAREAALQAEDDARSMAELVAVARSAIPFVPGVLRAQIRRVLDELGE